MAQPALHLYVDSQYASPYAMSVFVGLHEKGVPFDLSTVDLGAGANHAGKYKSMSLTQRVPTLVHGDFALSESSAITEYLDDVVEGKPLYPSDVRAKARARQIQAWLRSDLMQIRQERSTEVIFYGRKEPPLSGEAAAAAAKLFSLAEVLVPEGSAHLFETWCIADTDLALMLNRLVMNGDSVPKRLAAYAERQWRRPSVQLWANRERPTL